MHGLMAVSYLDIVYVCFILTKTYLVRKCSKYNNFKCHFCKKKTHCNNFKYHNSILFPSIKVIRIRLTQKSLHKLKNEYPTIGPFRNLLKIRITALYFTLICETGSVAKTASTKTVWVLHYMLSAKKICEILFFTVVKSPPKPFAKESPHGQGSDDSQRNAKQCQETGQHWIDRFNYATLYEIRYEKI